MSSRRRCRILSLAVVLCACMGLSSSDTSREWRLIGPGGGGSLFVPTVSPRDPNHVLVACDMTGSYRSEDGGASWQMFNLHGRVKFFAFDPQNENVIYAGSIGLWRSNDRGKTWSLVYPANVTAVAMSNDHAGETLMTPEGAAENVTAFAIDPSNSKTLYAAFQRNGKFEIRSSTDSAKTWQTIYSPTAPVSNLYVDPNSPADDRTVYAVSNSGIAVREHRHWTTRPFPSSQHRFMDVTASFASGSAVLYAVSSTAVYISSDGGRNWNESSLPGSGAKLRAVAASPSNADIAYLSFGNLESGLPGFKKTYFGIAKTEDRGRNWSFAWKSAGDSPANVQDAWITQFFGAAYADNPLALTVAPSNPNVVYATDYGRILRSTDGGRNWQQLYSSKMPDGDFTGRGLESTTSYGLHFDPFDRNRMFISYTDIGLFRSDDGGKNWTSSISGVPREWWNTTYWMVFDPAVRGRAWAVMSAVHDLPRPKMWQHKSPDTYDGGVCVSDDGGKNWQKSNQGMLPTAATHILLDPASPANARVLYIAAFGRGVYKSTDGGKSWTLKNNGIEGTEPLAWRLARDNSGTLYLIVARRSDDASIGNEGDGALFRSTDGAEHWTRLTLPSGVNGPNGLAIDPRDNRHLYLAAWGRSTHPAAQGGGIFVSNDAGKTWRNALSEDQHIYDVTVDYRNPNMVYAAGFESNLWRSTDAGKTWRRIRGFDFKWAHRVIPDPADSQQIYVTTFGGGVWHGPSSGDPQQKPSAPIPVAGRK